VYTFESYDPNSVPLLELTPDTEAYIPLAGVWSSYHWIEGDQDVGRAGLAMPWPKRTAVRVEGYIHVYARAPMSNDKGRIQMQIERCRVDDDTGTINMAAPLPDMFNPIAYDRRVYWRRQFFPTSNTTWLSGDWPPRPINIVVPVHARFRMPLDEQEVPGLGIAWEQWETGAVTSVFVRCLLRTQIEF